MRGCHPVYPGGIFVRAPLPDVRNGDTSEGTAPERVGAVAVVTAPSGTSEESAADVTVAMSLPSAAAITNEAGVRHG